jgi:hypothetical protein
MGEVSLPVHWMQIEVEIIETWIVAGSTTHFGGY